MITLKTGILGSGKSLSSVQDLAAQLDAWSKSGGEGKRLPIFVHGIRGLALEHVALPVYPSNGKPGDPVELDRMGRPAMGTTLAVDWGSVPDECLVVIDECQDIFPPRGSSARVPESVAWLQRSRHHAVDVVLITQHPRLIDSTVRAFVGKHQHYRRLFGGNRAVVYEWDGVSDGLQYKTATKSFWPYPRAAFKWYKSAEKHNKQAFKLPAWIIIPVLGIAAGVFAAPKAWHAVHGVSTGQGLTETSSSKPTGSTLPVSVMASASQAAPFTEDQPASDVHAQVQAVNTAASGGDGDGAEHHPIEVAGCIASADQCKCFDKGGMLLDRPQDVCRAAIKVAGKVLPLDVPLVRQAADVSPHSREVDPVPMGDVRAQAARPSMDTMETGRKTQAWQAPLLRDIARM